MSQTNTELGTLIKYQKKNETVLECCKRIMKEKGLILPEYFDNESEYIQFELSTEYFVYYFVYKIENFRSLEFDNICELSVNEDQNINFVIQYYNGETSMNEMLEEGFNKLRRKR